MSGRPHRAPRVVRPATAVFAGAMLGTAGRMAVVDGVARIGWGAPWGTFIVNVGGAFALGLLVGWRQRRPGPGGRLVSFGGIGVLGAFTTFATFSRDAVVLVGGGSSVAGAVYVAGSVLVGLAAAYLGLAVGRGP